MSSGTRGRTGPVPVSGVLVSEVTAADYAWLAERFPGLAGAFCIAFVRGLGRRRRYGGWAPTRAASSR